MTHPVKTNSVETILLCLHDLIPLGHALNKVSAKTFYAPKLSWVGLK